MTVRDVAARAGVSPATVSRVFSQPGTVAPDVLLAVGLDPELLEEAATSRKGSADKRRRSSNWPIGSESSSSRFRSTRPAPTA